MEPKIKRNKKNLNESFQRDEKITLIKAVEVRPCLWDLTDRKHSDAIFVKNAWASISSELNKPVSNCKSAWASLRDSLRYHRDKLAKSGSAGGVPLKQPTANEDVDWQFAPYMGFLPIMSSKRQTTSSINIPCSNLEPVADLEDLVSPIADNCSPLFNEGSFSFEESSTHVDDSADVSSIGSQAYSYQKPRAKKRKLEETSGSEKLVGILGNFLDKPKKEVRGAFQYWEVLLSTMPEDKQRKVEMEVTQLLLARASADENA